MNDKLLRLWLAGRTKHGAWRAEQLLSYFGDAESVYSAEFCDYMEIPEMKKSVAIALSDKSLEYERNIVSSCKEFGINIIFPEDKGFKKELSYISSPVGVLYTLGTIPDWDSILGVAIVGTRHFSEYGKVATERIATELASNGATIISGMATGIDSFALRSALKTGADVVAVMGCGLDTVYPSENVDLMNEIIKHGVAISEYPPGAPPAKHHFPERNRIVSGLADGVLAVEAPKRSGTLITTALAYDMGKTVFAVPGNIFHKNSQGTNDLIKKGAVAVTSAEDILDAFPVKANGLTPPKLAEEKMEEPIAEEKFDGLTDDENKVIELLRTKDMHTDEIVARSNLTVRELNPILTMLELDGYILKLTGNIYKYNTEYKR